MGEATRHGAGCTERCGRRAAVWLMIAFALGACARKPVEDTTAGKASATPPRAARVSPSTPSAAVRVMPSADLAETQWTLVRLRGRPLLPASHITLEIARDRMGGYDGCNWYGVRYKDLPTANPRSFQLLGGIESSARGCASDAHLQQSKQYFAALFAALELRLQGGRLRALDIDAIPLLEFERQPRFAMDPAVLVGSGWLLQAVDGKSRSHVPDQAITMRFGEGTLRGHAGCRDFTGTFDADQDRLWVPSLSMTTKECADLAALRREGEFTTLLSETHRYHYRADSKALTLLTSTGHRLQFVACDDCAR